MYLTTFEHVAVGQRFKVVWAIGEQMLLPPNTIYTKVAPGATTEGTYNATVAINGQLAGVEVADERAVLTWREEAAPEPLAELAPEPRLAWAQN